MARPENSLEYTSTGEFYRGSLIRELRWKKRLSRGRMAKLLGCNPDSLSKVETNGVNPSKKMLSKIAKVLEVPPEHFTKAPVHPRILRKGVQPEVAWALGSGVGHGRGLESEPQATSPPQHIALGQSTRKASAPSTLLNTPLSTSDQKILMHRLTALKKKVEATEKNLRDMRAELLEIEALASDMFGEEESHAQAPSTGSV